MTLRLNVRNKTRHLNRITARLNAAYEAIQEGIVIFDRNHRVVSANGQFTEITGIINPIGMQHTNLRSELARRFDLPASDSFWFGLKDRSELKTERRVSGVTQTQQSVIAYLSPVKDAEQHLGVLLALRDITEHAELEVSLRHAQKMEAVGRMAGGIAHDFNNLLMVMSAHNEGLMARVGQASGDIAESLQATEGAIQRATELVRNLMGFSRRTPLTLETHCLNDCIDTVVALLRRTVPSTIRIDTDLETGLPGCRIDRTQIEQVLMNICLNSRDALPKETGSISIETRLVSRENAKVVRLRVQDDGEGMSPAVQERVFEPFFTTKEVGKGTGLGMSTSYGIVEQHHGQIEIASIPASGTCVTITLPASEAGFQSDIETQPSRPTRHADRYDVHVLVVDDEDSVRRVSMKMLQRLGCTVSLAASGMEAIRMVNETKYDLVALDLNMPEMSGGDVLRRLAAEHPDIPVIVCTGYLDDALFDSAIAEPAAILRKPFRLHDLEVAMNEALSEFCGSPA